MLTLRTPDDHPLTLDELRAALGLRGIELSDSQLKRLRREGLLLVDEQRHRPGLHGSESLYPAWTVDQLELVERLARGERRFAQLRVLVRWHGGWVEMFFGVAVVAVRAILSDTDRNVADALVLPVMVSVHAEPRPRKSRAEGGRRRTTPLTGSSSPVGAPPSWLVGR